MNSKSVLCSAAAIALLDVISWYIISRYDNCIQILTEYLLQDFADEIFLWTDNNKLWQERFSITFELWMKKSFIKYALIYSM